MTFLGVDIGTTHSKAALFEDDGTLVRVAACPTPTERTGDGAHHNPERLWEVVSDVVREVVTDPPPRAVGVTSMAEAGLLLDRVTGSPRSPILAWYDTRSIPQSERLARLEDPLLGFKRSGLRPSFKYGLPKILWLRDEAGVPLQGAIWLSVADYIVYRLTGSLATDPTLAARTYAYSILDGRWDEDWIGRAGLEASLFPTVLASGRPAGSVTAAAASGTGLPIGTPAAVAGHDHICATLAVGVTEPGPILDSMGTAESIMAVATEVDLGKEAYETGLALVPHVLPGRFCWLGGLSSSGGSIEWLRQVLGVQDEAYEEIASEVRGLPEGPTSLIYFPYLVGSGAPLPDRRARAAFLGLEESHGRGDLFKAVLQGTAFEGESIRSAVAGASGGPSKKMIAVGGGARNREWLQIKADLSDCAIRVPDMPEATCLGAAFTAAVGSGNLSTVVDVQGSATQHCRAGLTIEPDRRWVSAYRKLYEQCYLPLRDAAHRYGELVGALEPEHDDVP